MPWANLGCFVFFSTLKVKDSCLLFSFPGILWLPSESLSAVFSPHLAFGIVLLTSDPLPIATRGKLQRGSDPWSEWKTEKKKSLSRIDPFYHGSTASTSKAWLNKRHTTRRNKPELVRRPTFSVRDQLSRTERHHFENCNFYKVLCG